MARRQYQAGKSHFLGQLAQGVAADKLGTGVGEETFALAFEMVVHDVPHDGIEQGIAEELQPLIVQRLALFVALRDAFVHQRQLIVPDVAGIEPHDAVKRRKKLLLLAERELDAVDDFTKPHTF